MAKRKKKTKTREELDKLIEQRGLEILQEIHGNEEGEKRYREIQEKVKAESERDRNETSVEREKRMKQERIDKWIKKFQGLSLTELLYSRDKFREDLRSTRRDAISRSDGVVSILEAEAKLDAIQHLIDNVDEYVIPVREKQKLPIPSDEANLPDKYMFSEFKKSYIEHVKTELAPKTLKSVERTFKHFEDYFGDKPMGSFVPEDLERYKASRKGKVKDVSINNEIRTIKAAFQKAVDWDRLKAHPFKNVKQIRVAQKKTPSFTMEQFKKLCSTIDDENILRIIKFAVLTGMRRGEIIGLKWENVDKDNERITVVTTEGHRVKGGKMRDIPIHPQVAEILEAVKNDSEYVFINKQKRPFNGDTVSKKFKDYVRDAGLSDELHFHSLRATFSSWLANQGASGESRQILLGHSDIRTTQGYTTYDTASFKGVLEKIKLPDTVENENKN